MINIFRFPLVPPDEAAAAAIPLIRSQVLSYVADLLAPDAVSVESSATVHRRPIAPRILPEDMRVVLGLHVRRGDTKARDTLVQRILDTFIVMAKDVSEDGEPLLACVTPSGIMTQDRARPGNFTIRVGDV